MSHWHAGLPEESRGDRGDYGPAGSYHYSESPEPSFFKTGRSTLSIQIISAVEREEEQEEAVEKDKLKSQQNTRKHEEKTIKETANMTNDKEKISLDTSYLGHPGHELSSAFAWWQFLRKLNP
jgi:hypothetical protein